LEEKEKEGGGELKYVLSNRARHDLRCIHRHPRGSIGKSLAQNKSSDRILQVIVINIKDKKKGILYGMAYHRHWLTD